MKKLMITAALAALTTGAFAGVPQVYEMTLNVKTTVCKKSNSLIKDACNPEGHYFYRAQTSYKFKGLFWGCGCPVIAQPNADQYGMPRLAWVDDWSCDDNSNSYMFWGPEKAFHHTDFKWELLQLVGQKTSNIEGTFNAQFFVCDGEKAVEPAVLDIRGAGYGTATVTACADEDAEDIQAASLNQIKSMSGSVVGTYDIADGKDVIGCKYCGVEVECVPYPFCPCVKVDTDFSSAYGTFTLKFHSSAASKVGNGKWIDEAYSFPKFVIAEFECIEEGAEPEPVDPEDERKAKAVKSYNAAKQGVADATAAKATADDEVKRLATKDTIANLSAKEQKGTVEGIAIYDADTNTYAKATAATKKAIETADKAEIAFRASYAYIGGVSTDADDLIAAAEGLIDANDAYNKAKATYDEVMANPDSTAAQKAAAKTDLLDAESTQKTQKDAYETIMKSAKATIMTATVKTDFANYEAAYKAEVDAKTAEAEAAKLPNTTKWLSNWGADPVVEGTQWAAYKAAQAAQTKANEDLTAAKETLRLAEFECVASGAQCF